MKERERDREIKRERERERTMSVYIYEINTLNNNLKKRYHNYHSITLTYNFMLFQKCCEISKRRFVFGLAKNFNLNTVGRNVGQSIGHANQID